MTGLKVSDSLTLPIDAVTQTLATIGRRGAGKTYLATMIAEQMLDIGAQTIILDPVALAHDTDTPATNAGLHHMIYAKLPGPEGRLLRPLIEAYPDAMTNEDLAHDAGYSAASSSYSVPRSRLKSFGLIEYPASGQVRARDILFPIGG